MRVGTRYRLSCFRAAHIRWDDAAAPLLDVGCLNGEFLTTVSVGRRIGLDVEPRILPEGVLFVQANGEHLPFCSNSIGQAVALDVIEHLQDGSALVQELLRVTCPGGRVLLTTPSDRIRLFPPFLTGWISRHWEHFHRRGFCVKDLAAMSRPVLGARCSVQQWSAPAFRVWYLFIRALDVVWPAGAGLLLDWVARWDARHRVGDHGFYWMTCRRDAT